MTVDAQHSVVLDVMGADRGAEEIIRGGVLAASELQDSLNLILVGKQELIHSCLSNINSKPGNIKVEHAVSEVPMNISATEGVKLKDSSISIGINLIKSGSAEAFVSPGNTGAVMASALLTLGRLKGVSRPAIATVFPTSTGKPSIVLDVGANADCKPLHLAQFAIMGSAFAEFTFGIESPRVGLLSIGEERSKGNELIFGSQELLKDLNINFVGNVEGRDIMSGTTDVVVTDGFTGNILLKFAESIQPLMVKAVRRQIQTNIFSRIGTMLLLPFMRRMKDTFDYAESGGAPLLGTNGIITICHGSSNARAIYNAVKAAYSLAKSRINEHILTELSKNQLGKNNGSNDKSQDTGDRVVHPSSVDD